MFFMVWNRKQKILEDLVMNKPHIQKAIDKYNTIVKEELKISPISQGEANIIKEVREIFKKLQKRDLVAILDNYKYYADSDIEHSLLEWNTNFNISIKESKEVDEEKEVYKRKFIEIEGEYLEVCHIYRFNKFDCYNQLEMCQTYNIIINETPPETTRLPLYANTIFTFYNEEERNEVYNKFKMELGNSGNIEYI